MSTNSTRTRRSAPPCCRSRRTSWRASNPNLRSKSPRSASSPNLSDARIESELRRESDYLFTLQLRDYLVQKAGLKMPEAFLKRWLYTINEGKFSMEDIDKDFDQFLKMFTWNYLQKHFIKQDNITVTKDEALAEAKALAAAQFAQYGMPSAPEDMLAGYAEKILADKDQGQKIYEKLYEVKVVEDVKSKIKVTEKAVSADDFAKLAKAL